MHNCIFSAHCLEEICDSSCPILAETSYLLERNKIGMDSIVFKVPESKSDQADAIISEADKSKLLVVQSRKTSTLAELITYVAICRHWKGSQLKCTVYNLKLGNYIDKVRSSWSKDYQDDGTLDYMKIFIETSKILVISGMDYTNFKDFESQTLLNILQQREDEGKTTIVVSPALSQLIGNGQFYNRLKKVLESARGDHGNIY